MTEPLVTLVRAKSPSMLYALVMDEVVRGNYLSQPMFVGNDGFLCQWVEAGNDFMDYVLLEALTGAELESKVRQMCNDGYYMVFKTLPFIHGYLQWMARGKDHQMARGYEVAAVSQKLMVVEDVRPLGRLAPAVSFDVAVEYVREAGS